MQSVPLVILWNQMMVIAIDGYGAFFICPWSLRSASSEMLHFWPAVFVP